MDLSHLTRPGILSQCSRCSSSLAALENEWAKLSNVYAIPTAWLSVDLHRISVSSERKQIPHTSDMTVLRGRIIQEISCKLCQQRIGVLCPFDTGMNILWKMNKVAFREIVTMRTVQPQFKQGTLERLLCPTPKEPPRRTSEIVQDTALVPAGVSDPANLDPSVQRQMLSQGRSIDQISNSVNHLQDTMSDLKHSFTALRIELNGPNRHIGEGSFLQGHDFDMIATVLRELKSKSDEIEKLKLEIEALKLKNRYMGGNSPQPQQDSLSVLNMNSALPEVRSPGLLQAGRKRTWPDAFPVDRGQSFGTYFDENDMTDDSDLSFPAVRESCGDLKDQQRRAITSGPSEYGAGSGPAPQNGASNTNQARSQPPQQTMAKRPRLNPSNGDNPEAVAQAPAPRGRGRPRKSTNPPPNPNPDIRQPPNPTLNGQGTSADSTGQPTLTRRQSRRSLRATSPDPSYSDNDQDGASDSQQAANKKTKRNTGSPNGSRIGVQEESLDEIAMNEKRKAKVAARDVMAKMALQQEEAREAGNTR
ncbi:hypothetical protein PENANT_c003G03285 [Penicillium antarcticum]|uniref:Mis18 domain-containing protein n=1 Tax=Penicillium antarcticum TaxID=416450 RepID=A0A1V6QIJ3_9EURO|nr:uncharacterized protein N7508_005991 [Penicillium antarcticum]KAJ5306976.1 hypothetical protein N7508_005991 [Penicillium antarcticum]OQD88767.1 hypothetical protein PENANT_c003G03285 [Penicillium antarcticum]